MQSRLSLGLGVLLIAGIANAQDPPRPPLDVRIPLPPFSFGFSPPGARALAMGGAFIGSADDATAAESNPAGLVILQRPEVSGHLALASYSNESSDYLFRTQSNREDSDSVTSPAFFSFVYPINNVSLSAYYQQATAFQSHSRFSADARLCYANFDCGSFYDGGPATVARSSDITLDHLGLSAALKLGDRVAIGASARYSRLSFAAKQTFDFTGVDEASSGNIALTERITASDRFDETASKLTFNVGLLVNPGGKVSAGLVYKKGASYDFSGRFQRNDEYCCGYEPYQETANIRTTLSVPDFLGAGLRVRPTDRLVLAADLARITYSDMDPGPARRDPVDGEAIKDATEVHAGAEYTFFASDVPVSVRAGAWTDPDHDGNKRVDSEQVHFSLGGGVVLKKNFQIDAAYAFSDQTKQALLSVVYRFE